VRCHQPFLAGSAAFSSAVGVVSISAGSCSVQEGDDEALGVGGELSVGVVSISSFTTPYRSCAGEACDEPSAVGAVGEWGN
jgi:hypothetical protein